MADGPEEPIEHKTLLEQLGIELDRDHSDAVLAGRLLGLTAAEFRLLDCLLQARGRTCLRAELLEAVTQGQAVVEPRTINVHISALRHKLGDPRLIETVRKVGYRLRPAPPSPSAEK